MSVTLLHIYHDDDDPHNVSAEVKIPTSDLMYCVNILHTMDKVKSSIVNQMASQNKKNLRNKKGVLEIMRKLFRGKITKEEEEMLQKDIEKFTEAEEIGKGIQSTLSNLQIVLNKSDPEERNRLIKDINSTIQNITKGA